MGDARLSAADMRQLREDEAKERRIEVDTRFRALVKEADAIPLRNRTQYPVYLEVRTMHLIRGIAEVEGTTIQEFLREVLERGVASRIKAKGGGPKKRVSSKKRS